MADRLFVFGSGGHAKVIIEAVRARSPRREIVIVDDSEAARSRSIFGIAVSGGRELLDQDSRAPVALAIGDNRLRYNLMTWLTERGRNIEAVVHPAAALAESVALGAGAFVSAGAVAIADARVGRGAIINTGATVDHDCIIGEAAHIAPGAHLCGSVEIGERTLIGVGAAVRPGITICADAVVGAGAVVVADIETAGTFVGSPARRMS